MKHLCIWLIRMYQKWLSPRKRNPTCRFYPTCSAYAIEAFQKRGFFAGLWLTFFRILRCNPFCPGGYDPVPERGLRVKPYVPDWDLGEDDTKIDKASEDEDAKNTASKSSEPNAVDPADDDTAREPETDRGAPRAKQANDDTPPRAAVRYLPDHHTPR